MYLGATETAAVYLVQDRREAAFIDTNTTRAVPRLLEALRAAELTPADVRYVIVTHIHLDHGGGAGELIGMCPNATVLAHPRAVPHLLDPTRLIASARGVYGELFDDLYGEVSAVTADRVRALEDGACVELGRRSLRFLHTRGHANHHFCIHDEQASAVFTGDAFGIILPGLQRNGLCAFPSASPTDFDAPAAHDSIEKILATGARRVFPTHFGEHLDLTNAGAELHRQIDLYAEIVDEADSSGRGGAALEDFCLARVTTIMDRQLERLGLRGDAVARRLVEMDTRLNGWGLAFAVRKRRHKRSRGHK